MRVVLLAVLAALLLSIPASALEKTRARVIEDRDHPDTWSATTTCTLVYYNYCTGWIWCWGGWDDHERFGVCFECPGGGTEGSFNLNTVGMYNCQGTIPGYGYTATVDVWAANDYECPSGPSLASQPLAIYGGWLETTFDIQVPSRFVVTLTTGTNLAGLQSYATDHPAAGPTGPPACGTCYPSSRVTHSYYYGTTTSPLCPGFRFNDGVCYAELIWDIGLSLTGESEGASWRQVETLYR